MDKNKIEIIVDCHYYYKGSINEYLNIIKREQEDTYPVYCLVNDYGETMYMASSWLGVCKYSIDLINGKYA